MESVNYNPIVALEKAFKTFRFSHYIVSLVMSVFLFWLLAYKINPLLLKIAGYSKTDISYEMVLFQLFWWGFFSLFGGLYMTYFFSEFIKEVRSIHKGN